MDIKTYQKEQLDRVEGALGVAQGKAQLRGSRGIPRSCNAATHGDVGNVRCCLEQDRTMGRPKCAIRPVA